MTQSAHTQADVRPSRRRQNPRGDPRSGDELMPSRGIRPPRATTCARGGGARATSTTTSRARKISDTRSSTKIIASFLGARSIRASRILRRLGWRRSAASGPVVAAQRERNCVGGCALVNLASELSDVHEGFRARLTACFSAVGRAPHRRARRGPRLPGALRRSAAPRRSPVPRGVRRGAILMTKLHKSITVMERWWKSSSATSRSTR